MFYLIAYNRSLQLIFYHCFLCSHQYFKQNVLQLFLSIGMFIPECKKHGFEVPSVRFALPFAIPALLYCLNNNIAVHMQLQMDPASYQVFTNLCRRTYQFYYSLLLP